MKKIYLLLLLAIFYMGTTQAQNVTVSGSVGTDGSYATLGAAFTAINGATQTGATISIGIVSNTTEAASAVLNAGAWTSMSIQPVGGTSKTISGAIAGILLDLNGADNVTIDGLNTGGNSLTIDNTSATASASTIRFIADATGNTVQNCTIKGAGTGTAFGVIFFSTGTSTGNDNNIINLNNITASGASQPVNGIYSAGTSAAIDNSNVTISNNNISDFFSAGSATVGINVNATGNSTWTINANKLFQTATRTYTTGNTHNGILVGGGNGYIITNNIIGYASSAGTGTYTMAGTVATRLIGINLAVGTTVTSSVQGNTITAINLSTSSGAATTNGVLCGINITGGNVNVGNVTANVIGASSGIDKLVAIPTTTQGAVVGINTSSTNTILIQGNTIGGLSSAPSTATLGGAVFGINVSGTATSMTISGNTIGNATADNMRAGTSGLTTTGSSLAAGMNLTSGPTACIIDNNTVQNFTSFQSTTGTGYAKGIAQTTGGVGTQFTNNTVHDIKSGSALTAYTSGLVAVTGIYVASGTNTVIAGNTIYNLAATNTGTANITVSGISCAAITSATVRANTIYNLSNAGTGTTSTAPPIINGILIRSGTTSITVFNNMISLGNSQTTNTLIVGIWGNHGSTPDPIDNIYHNTVNIEGTAASGALSSFCFNRGDFSGTQRTPTVDIRNNIFTNSRNGGTGSHFAISNNFGATVTSTGWGANASNYNVLNANAATIGYWGANQTFSVWKTSSASDGLSYSGIAVTYVNSASNLHLNMGASATSIESGGTSIPAVTVDIDGQGRPGPAGSVNGGGTAPDLGADEFDGVPLDIFPPTISYTALANTSCTTDRTFGSVTVTDPSGINVTAGTRPRLYYKKSTQGNTFNDNTNATDGWKYVEASGGGGSPFSFTTDYSLLNGGAPINGDIIQYFVVAQDNASTPNVAINSGTFTATPASVALTAGAFPIGGTINSYTIVAAGLSGTKTIGVAGDYATLTGAGGLFSAINSSGLSGNLTVNILDASITEPGSGTNALNAINYNGCAAGPYTLTIKPGAGVNATLTGSVGAGSIIKLNGADNVTIDGSNNGTSSRNLIIENTTATTSGNAVVWLASPAVGNGANNNIIKNCTIQGASATTSFSGIHVGGSTTIGITTAGTEANNNNTITNNLFRKTQYGLTMFGWSATAPDLNNIVSNNNFGTAIAGEGFSVAGMNTDRQTNLIVSGNEVQNVTIGGTAATQMFGIRLLDFKNGLCYNNKVHDISYTGTSTEKVYGINVTSSTFNSVGSQSTAQIYNNIVYKLNSSATGTTYMAGIIAGNGYGDKYYYNSVHLTGQLANTASASVAAFAHGNPDLTATGTNIDVRDNIFSVTGSSGAAGGNFWAYTSQVTTVAGSTLNYNDLYCNGTNATNNVGRFNSTNYTTLAAWQTATSMEANSIAADPMLNSPSNLIPSNGSPVLGAANNAGTGVTVDIQGTVRSNGVPPAGSTMGAYETAGDFSGPIITYTAITNSLCFTDRTLSATITDASGVNVAPGTKPRLYFKKSTDANNYVGNTSGDNGWKYVEATNAASPFSFTTNYALLQAPIAGGDIIQYFVVAQDLSAGTFVSINSGTFAATPSSVALTSAAFPLTGTINQYTVLGGAINSDVTIGAAGTYPTLTGAGGLFAAINAGGLGANINATILDPTIAETGANALNQIAYGCAGSYTLTIKPATGVTTTLSGAVASGALIKLNGADNVIIDGSNNGTSSRNMTITNTSTTSPTAVSFASIGAGAGAVSNTIKNCNISTGASGATGYGISVGGSTPGTSGADNDNTTIQNNNITVATVGIYANGTASASAGGDDNLLITGNSVNSNTTIQNQGIQVGNALNSSVSLNTVSVESSGTVQPVGISLETGFVSSTVTQNTITKAYASNTGGYGGRGITVGTGTATSALTIANNVVYGVNGTNWSGFTNSSSAGIWIGTIGGSGTVSTTTGGVNLYYNSVSMTGSMNNISTTAVTAALYIGSAASALDIRNNIFSNTQVATSTTQKNYGVYCTSANTAFSNMNYNDYYVANSFNAASAIPGFIGSDRTTLAAFVTGFGQNAGSISADPLFNNPASNLVIGLGSPAIGAANTAGTGITTDFFGVTRSNGVPPSGSTIGAYENAADAGAPTITYTILGNTSCASDRTFSGVAITDPSGVNVTAGTAPRLYFKKSTDNNAYVGNTSADNGWKYVEASNATSPFSFTTNYSLLQAPVAGGDVIQYFVVAQDNATTPNVGINSGTFAAAPTSVALTGAAFPIGGTINSYSVVSALGTSLTIGAAGTYTNLTGAAGLFNAINNATLSGNTTVTILDASITEPGTVALNSIGYGNGCVAGGPFTLTIKPGAGVTATLTGSVAGGALIKLNGADNVIFDGSNNGSNSKDLTITNTNATGTTVIWVGSTAADGSTNNTIKNCIIRGNTGTTTVADILVGSGVTAGNAAEVSNSNLTVMNNTLTAAQNGVYFSGNATTLDAGLIITGNLIGSAVAADKMGFRGVGVGNAQSFIVNNNTIAGISSTTSSTAVMSGVQVFTNINGGTISGNTFTDIKHNNTTGYGAVGIYLSAATTASNITASNNFISDVAGKGFNGADVNDNGYGIAVASGGGYKIYYNTISLGTNQTAAGSITAAINILAAYTTVGALDIRNNIFSNTETVGTRYAIYNASTAGNTVFSAINFNDYAAQNIGYQGSAQATLANWQTASAQDQYSKNIAPVFVSATDLHLTAANCGLDNRGTPIAGITTDIDAALRDAGAPDIGADEYSATPGTAIAAMAPGNTSNTAHNASTNAIIFSNDNCELIAKLDPQGATPVSGIVTAKVTVDPSVQYAGIIPYVQRHTDIEPATNASTSTGTVTIVALQSEFDAYNVAATAASMPLLPTNPGDAAGIANLKVTQWHGTGTAPGNYTGSAELIDPVDANITWNVDHWEIKFNVTGFSGFFIHTGLAVVPVTIEYFRGSKQPSGNYLDWKVTCTSSPSVNISLERSGDGSSFAEIHNEEATAVRCQQSFNYTDNKPLSGANYYRLKLTSPNGSFRYSNVIKLMNNANQFEVVSMAPNPVRTNAMIIIDALKAGNVDIAVSDLSGRVLVKQSATVIPGTNSINLELSKLSAGTYQVVVVNEAGEKKAIRFVKL